MADKKPVPKETANKGKEFKKPSPIGSKSTANRVKDPRALVNFRAC